MGRREEKTAEDLRKLALGRAATLTEQLVRVLAYIAGSIGGEVSAVISSAPDKNEGIYISRNTKSDEYGAPFDRFCDLYEIVDVYEEHEDGLIARTAKVGNVKFFTIEEGT